ncbi:hypothetical protein CFIO01_13751, partial [Colletotrichum fioriniae PJ7]
MSTVSNNRTTQPAEAAAPTIQQLHEMIIGLKDENQQLHAQLLAPRPPSVPRAKYPEPEPYDGSPDALQGFLTRTRAYLRYYGTSFVAEADKVHYAASFLRKDALAWFEPSMRDHLENLRAQQDSDTRKIFDDYE